MSADQRVALAREYLAGARRRKVGQLPPSALMRELAETRRQLGQVLEVIDQAATLDDDQAAIVLSALEDASEDIRKSAAHWPCRSHPADLCDEDADRLSRADANDHLGATLRKAAP